MVKRRTWIITGVVLAIVVLGLAGLALKSKGGSGPQGEELRIENPSGEDLVEFINAPGEVQPRTKVAISAKVMARIVDIPVEEGQAVTKGDPNAHPPVEASVLLRLDAADLTAALRSAEARRSAQAAQIEVEKLRLAGEGASLEGINASCGKAELDLKRCRELVKSGDMTQSDLDAAQSTYDELKARLIAAGHSLEAAEKNIEVLRHSLEAADAEIARARDAVGYTTITSPINGVVTRINAEVGELVVTGTMNNPGTVIMEVADLSQMLLVVQVDEVDIGAVKVGQQAVVRIHTYADEQFEGVVESIALTHDISAGGAKYFKVKILLDTRGRRIYSGLTADVDIQTKTHSGILKVPSQAVLGCEVDELPLVIRDNNPCVDRRKTFATVVYRFIDGEAVVTPVTTGASDLTHTVIRAGISADDRIIVGPYKVLESLKHEQKVQDEREAEKRRKAAEKDER
ncbi:MAG: efflux RND transporter periplasmic adaptor subunit [Planctomycetes bacterium]|nr:efflux RND transporter periplasmic adaptor subunit [Planctomycetota bacterium]